MKKIVICGDIVPTESNYTYFDDDIGKIVQSEILSIIHNSSFAIFNCESPMYDGNNPIVKDGPSLSAPTSTMKGIKQMGFNLATIGNNHILDHGQQGLESTICTLKKYGIDYVGGGYNELEASKPYYFEFAGKTIGVYACTDHEFTLADSSNGGANHFDPLFSLDHIANAKNNCEYLIVLYHGSKEYYRYPTPNTQKKCRRMIDKGANLVLCQHSHCIGCEEDYLDGKILYGQGNFLFDRPDNEYRNSGIMVTIDESLNVSYVFVVKNGNGVRLANESELMQLTESFLERGKKIHNDQFILDSFRDFCISIQEQYLTPFVHMSLIARIMNRLTRGKYRKEFIMKNEAHLIRMLNYMRCEAHQEVWIKILQENCKNDKSV